MSFGASSGLNLMARPQNGHQRPESRRPGAARAREGDALRCDVTGVAADVAAVDALARLALTLRRQGGRLELCGASEELRTLVTFMGLTEVLPNAEAAGVTVQPDAGLPRAGVLSRQRGKAEQREERVGGEEEGELDDPPA
jgi:ABC-type transporter Mla MlaB component